MLTSNVTPHALPSHVPYYIHIQHLILSPKIMHGVHFYLWKKKANTRPQYTGYDYFGKNDRIHLSFLYINIITFIMVHVHALTAITV